MDDRGQVSDPVMARMASVAWYLLGIYLLASLLLPDLQHAADTMYPVAWAVFVLPIVIFLLAGGTQTEREDLQKRLTDYDDTE